MLVHIGAQHSGEVSLTRSFEFVAMINLVGPFMLTQDIEFTVQENRLWMLQCRSGKRTGKSAVKIAVDMVNEGIVDTRIAIKMVEPQHLDQLLHPQV